MKGVLPQWLADWLGHDAAGNGEGAVWQLNYVWNWAPWISLLFVAVLALLIAFCYMREAPSIGRFVRAALIGLRLAALAIVLAMIAQFTLSLERTGLPYLVVLVDDSASMGVVDRYDDDQLTETMRRRLAAAADADATRLDLARSILTEDDAALLRAMADRYKLRLYFVADSARRQSGDVNELAERIENAEPVGESTRLGQGVRDALDDLRGAPPTAVVLLTDGVNTEGEGLADAAAYARRKGVPIYAVAIGSDRPSRDLVVGDLLVDDVVFVDDVVNFEFKVTGAGLAGRQVDVVLREGDDPTALARAKIEVGSDGEPVSVRLPYRPAAEGEFEYVVEVEPLSEEVKSDNNSQRRLVSVRKEQIRVLLAQGYPNYEYRYLKHLLERDGTIMVRTFLQEADPGYATIDQSALPAFPVRREDLFEYDVVILGDLDPALLGRSAMENVADFVAKKGGGAIFVAGPRFMPAAFADSPLSSLLPVEGDSVGAADDGLRDGFHPQPTDLGMAAPGMQLGDSIEESRNIWSQLPPLFWLFKPSRLKPAARVLVEHPTRTGDDGRPLPVICQQFVGAGKVVFHATDETWRWRYRVGDVLFARYWVQTIRHLSRSKLLGADRAAELTVDRNEYRRGESVRIRLRFADDRQAPASDENIAVVVEQAGAANRTVPLRRSTSGRGVFEGSITGLGEGRCHAWLASPALEGKAPSADFLVVAPPGEFESVNVDSNELRGAAEDTRGKFFTVENASQLRKQLPVGRQVPIESLPPIPLWNQWPLLLLFVSLLVGEWVLRKRQGLL